MIKNSSKIEYKIGDKVYLKNTITKAGKSKQLSERYTGPYTIVDIKSPVNCTLQIKK